MIRSVAWHCCRTPSRRYVVRDSFAFRQSARKEIWCQNLVRCYLYGTERMLSSWLVRPTAPAKNGYCCWWDLSLKDHICSQLAATLEPTIGTWTRVFFSSCTLDYRLEQLLVKLVPCGANELQHESCYVLDQQSKGLVKIRVGDSGRPCRLL